MVVIMINSTANRRTSFGVSQSVLPWVMAPAGEAAGVRKAITIIEVKIAVITIGFAPTVPIRAAIMGMTISPVTILIVKFVTISANSRMNKLNRKVPLPVTKGPSKLFKKTFTPVTSAVKAPDRGKTQVKRKMTSHCTPLYMESATRIKGLC